MGNEFFSNEKTIWTKPFHLRAGDTRYLVPAVEAIALTMVLDKDIYRNVQVFKQHNPDAVKYGHQITKGGETFPIEVAAAFVAGGLLLKDKKAIRTGVLATSALVHAGIFVTVVKDIAGRERPLVEAHNGDFEFIPSSIKESNHNSFPSGHTISAFSVATVIATEYQKTIWVPILSYALATGVGLSRMTEQKHWPSDVLVGGMMGYAIGRLVVAEHNKKWNILPSANTKGAVGLQVRKTF
jgi:membrane-associated phospholipid phosphatase